MNNTATTSDTIRTLTDLFNHDKSLGDKSSATGGAGAGDRSVMSNQTAPARVAGKTNSGILVTSSSSRCSRSPKRAQTMTEKDKDRAVRKVVDFNASFSHPSQQQRHRSTSAGRRNGGRSVGCGGGSNSPKNSSTVRKKLKDGLESVMDGESSFVRRNRSTAVDLAASASSFSTTRTRTRSSSNDKGHKRSDRPRELSRKSRSLSRDRSTESGSKSKQNTATRKGTRPGKRSEQDKTKNNNANNESSFKSTSSDDTKTTATTAATASSSSSRVTVTTRRQNPPPPPPRSTSRSNNKSRSPKRSPNNPKRSPARGRSGRSNNNNNNVSTTANSSGKGSSGSNRPTLAVVKNMNSANLLNELDQMDVATLQRMQDKINLVMRVRSLSPDANERSTRRGGDDNGCGGGGRRERAKMSRQMSSQNADLADIILSMSFNDEKIGCNVNRSEASPYDPSLSKSLGYLKAPSLSTVTGENSPNGSHSSNLKPPSFCVPSTPNDNQGEDQSATPLRSNFLRQKAFFRKESPCETSTKTRKRQIALLAKSKGFIANIRANLRPDENKTNSDIDPLKHDQLLLQPQDSNDDSDEGESDAFDVGQPLPRMTVDKIPEQPLGFTRLDSSSSRSTVGWGSFDPTSNIVT